MEPPYLWDLYRCDAPAGKFPIVFIAAIVALFLVTSALAALKP
jgi:hypothetical protein